jgi:long-chain fatty acid transport protein
MANNRWYQPSRGKGVRAVLAVALCACPFGAARAGSFFIEEGSVSGTGRAFAGQSARGTDASAIFYNPANVVGLPSIQLVFGNYLALARADLDNTGSEVSTPGTALSGSGPSRVMGGDGGNPLGSKPLGSFAAGYALPDERTWLGLSVSTPFGIDIDFGNKYFGRYGATKTEMAVADVNPTIGYRLSDSLSVGASLVFRYTEADFQSALPDPLAPGGPTPDTDGEASIQGNDWDVGYAVGVRYQPVESTTVGIGYRSGTHAKLHGRARFSGLQGPLSVRNGRVGADTDFSLPDMVLIGAAHELTPRLTLLAQANWFDWSDFDAVQIETGDGTRINSEQGYHDSWSGSIGAEYRMTDALLLRAGAQIDKTPVDDSLRSVRTPDEDRLRLTAGFTYKLTSNLEMDVAYAHVFVRDSEIDRTDRVFEGTPVATTVQTRARAEASADIVGVAFRSTF